MSETLIDIDPVKDAKAKRDFERLYDAHAKRKKQAISSLQTILRHLPNTEQSNTS